MNVPIRVGYIKIITVDKMLMGKYTKYNTNVKNYNMVILAPNQEHKVR